MSEIKLRLEVQWFAEQMELALRDNDWKGGWQADPQLSLLHRIRQETTELQRCLLPRIYGGNPKLVIREAADIANFAMMIADNDRRRA